MRNKPAKIRFVFEHGTQKKDFNSYIKEAELNIKKLDKLFPASPSNIEIQLFKNRVAFLNALDKKEAPSWLTAYVPSNSTSQIFLFCEQGKRDGKINQVLLHEMAHLYTNTLNPGLADWLKEGVSVYIAQQIFNPIVLVSDWTIIAPNDNPFQRIPWESAAEHNGYSIAGLLVMFIVRQYGWDKFIETIGHCQIKLATVKEIFSIFNNQSDFLMVNFKSQFVKNVTSLSQ